MGEQTTIKFQNDLEEILAEREKMSFFDEVEIDSVETFEAAGILTRDKGLVVKLNDFSEFFITIQKKGE
jgi:hypothetical protein